MRILLALLTTIVAAVAQEPKPVPPKPVIPPTYMSPLGDGSDLDKAVGICNRNAVGPQRWNSEVHDTCFFKIGPQWRAAQENSDELKRRAADKALLDGLVK
jgi:hypothetical protein